MSKTPKKTQTPLELFEQAYHELHGKPTKYTALKLARPQYYEAHKVGTLEAYLGAAHGVLNAQSEHKSEIWFAKKKIRKARDMCSMQGMLRLCGQNCLLRLPSAAKTRVNRVTWPMKLEKWRGKDVSLSKKVIDIMHV